ncbi:MAG: hypothetical protein QOI47_1206 [Actinomycetota bacterium]|jgi:hypothetical protein|nr:hypothetical protein [Actinomycetota bacterium]
MAFADRIRALTRNQKILVGTGVLVVVVLVIAVLVSAGGGSKQAATTTTSSSIASTTTTRPPVAPLTGLAQSDAAKLSRPALIAKVDNTPDAMSLQEGVDKADLVYVEEVEQGVTRLAVVFQSQDDTVGPVRSARTSDLEVAADLGNPLFCYSGANGGVLRMVRSGPMTDMGVDRPEATPVYLRNQHGQGVHRFFLPTDQIYAVARRGASTPPMLFTYRSPGTTGSTTSTTATTSTTSTAGVTPTAGAGEAAKSIQISYAGNSATTVRYDWTASGWARTQYGRPHVMADDKAQLTPKNVIVQFTPYHDSGFRDVTHALSPEATLTGSGEAWVFTGGTVVRGRWTRATRGVVTTYTDAGGKPIELTPGQTFVELVPSAGSVLGAGTVMIG